MSYPSCFYEPVSCPRPCTRPEYAHCPVNPEVRVLLHVEGGAEKVPRYELPPEVQRLREEAGQRELLSNPHAREVTEALRRRSGGGLVCPSCGDNDHGNRNGKRPWCMKCNLPLMSRERAAAWVKPRKVVRFGLGGEEVTVCRV